MDQEETKNWLKENWFKLGILAIGLMVAYFFWQVLVVQPRMEREERKTTEFNQKLEEETRRTEAKSNLDQCVADADKKYSSNWNNSCKSLGRLSERCEIMLIDSPNIFDAFKKYQEWHPGATFQEFSKAYDECSCLLPTTQATRWDDTLKEDKNTCYRLYPQN